MVTKRPSNEPPGLILGAFCAMFRARPFGAGLGAKFGRKAAKNRNYNLAFDLFFLAVLRMIFNLFLGQGVPGEGPDCHVPKEIVGFGPIPARILGFLILILALKPS